MVVPRFIAYNTMLIANPVNNLITITTTIIYEQKFNKKHKVMKALQHTNRHKTIKVKEDRDMIFGCFSKNIAAGFGVFFSMNKVLPEFARYRSKYAANTPLFLSSHPCMS